MWGCAAGGGVDTMSPMPQPTAPHAQAAGPHLSLVIPAYNEAEVIPTLLARVESSLRAIGRPTASAPGSGTRRGSR
jgi:hypothetical protein